MRFEPVAPVRAYERVVEQIEQAVISGALKPGERLPSERELMTQFGVGRSTVREALRVLQAARNDPVAAGRSARARGPGRVTGRIAPVDAPARARRPCRARRVAAVPDDPRRLGPPARRRLRTDDDLTGLDTAMESMREAVSRGYAEFSRADVAFHEVIARIHANPLMVVMRRSGPRRRAGTDRGQAGARQQPRVADAAWLAHHAEVLDAIRAADGAGAAHLAKQALYDNYADYVPAGQPPLFTPLLR